MPKAPLSSTCPELAGPRHARSASGQAVRLRSSATVASPTPTTPTTMPMIPIVLAVSMSSVVATLVAVVAGTVVADVELFLRRGA